MSLDVNGLLILCTARDSYGSLNGFSEYVCETCANNNGDDDERWWWRRPRRLPTNISILEWMGGWGYSTLKLWGKPKRDNDLWYSRAHALAEPQQQPQQEHEEVTEMTDTVSLCVHVRPTAADADDKREVDVWVFILFTLVEHWSFATMAAKSSWLRCKMCLM